MSFAALGVPAALCARLQQRNLTQPFPIQAATLPDALDGHDVCGRAPTGSGKTLAFGLVVAARAGKRRPRQPRALVLTPTRELAAQIRAELAQLVDGGSSAVVAIYGGMSYEPQRRALSKGVSVVVACPGRLEDLVAQQVVDLSGVEIAVVDEADRMADMGFLPPVRRLLDQTRPDRQTLLFSATLDREVDALIRNYQRDPRHHSIIDEVADAAEVDHHFWRTERAERVTLTADLVDRHGRTMVFTRTRHGADRLMKQLVTAGIPTVAVHGGRSQSQRDRALGIFTAGKAQALVATDVAARGIHVDAVACVVHFDPPADAKDYVHRSGRTGRAGQPGVVVTLAGSETAKAVKRLQRELGHAEGLQRPGGTRTMKPKAATTATSATVPAGTAAATATTASQPASRGDDRPQRERNRRDRHDHHDHRGHKPRPPKPGAPKRTPRPGRRDHEGDGDRATTGGWTEPGLRPAKPTGGKRRGFATVNDLRGGRAGARPGGGASRRNGNPGRKPR